MNIFYSALLAILFTVCVCLFVLHRMDESAIKNLEDQSRQQADELRRINGKLSRLEIRQNSTKEKPDKIVIVHKYEECGDLDFPNKREEAEND